ncbi:MAG: hypothetical protein BAJALOKI1v1_480013 [Promethearchaeota archaeon]|nr:MAG: hypothetical protein BAJALOKI1v1_480013 [Candidatus Lokiarchaeota archaeon]
MEVKDGIIGVLIVALVGLAGGLGYVIISQGPTSTTLPNLPTGTTTTTTYESGLPDDWTTAPNSSYFLLNNQTQSGINITLGDILEQVIINEATEKYNFSTGIGVTTMYDPDTGIPVTGIYLTDFFDIYYTYFPGDIIFTSHEDDEGTSESLSISAYDLLDKTERKDTSEKMIIALAANKKWLQNSQFKDTWGDFTVIAEDTGSRVCNLKEINVTSNWTLTVEVDGIKKLELSPYNITNSPSHTYNYTYDRFDKWNYDREITGINLSKICEWAGVDENDNFEVKARAVDGWASPHGKPWRPGFTEDDVYNNIDYDSRYWDYVNSTDGFEEDDGHPLPASTVTNDMSIMIVYSQKLNDGEIDLSANPPYPTNPEWPEHKMVGMKHGPYIIAVPGRIRENFIWGIYKIEINTIPDVDFDYNDTQIATNDWVQFTFNGSLYYPTTNYTFSWFINCSTDGTPNVTGSNTTIDWQFTSAGNYTISLVVEDKFDGSEGVKTREDLIEVT